MYEWNKELYDAWKHGQNGGSIFGAPVNGAFTAWAFSDGRAEHNAAATRSLSYTTPPSSFSSSYTPPSSYSGSYGGGYSGSSPGLSGYSGSSAGEGFLGLVGLIVVGFLVAAFLGAGHSASTTLMAKTAVAATAYGQGATDRRAWENWFASLSGDTRAGADYWASVRNVPNHGCTVFRRASDGFIAGCNSAKRFFDDRRVDIRRKDGSGYWDGWNSL